MVYQSDPNLPPEIRRWGCYFLSLLRSAKEAAYDAMSEKEIIAAKNAAVAAGWLRDDCYVLDPVSIYNSAAARHVKRVFHAPVSHLPGKGEIEILRFGLVVNGEEWAHFVLGDGKGAVVWDPYPASAVTRKGRIKSKRILA